MIASALALLSSSPLAQSPGTLKKEKHPAFDFSTCTKAGGCSKKTQEIVIDSNWRWTHANGKTDNCYTGNHWSEDLCPDVATCTANCAIEGADAEYEGTYGVKASGDTLELDLVTKGPYSANVGSRTYLMQDSKTYQMFKLKNREFTFDADVSAMPCGVNGALYFVQMDADGGLARSPGNKAGAEYGTGYCDAQCPHDIKFIDGQANSLDWKVSPTDPNAGTGKFGSCCVEMDIWEANSISTAYTAHACSAKEYTPCSGVDCGDNPNHRFDGVCDKNGCDFQTYRMGNTSFFGPASSFTIDSTKKVTVVTQFITEDGTDSGKLSEIRRHYVQDGRVIPTPTLKVGKSSHNSISTDYCEAEVGLFQDHTNFLKKGGFSSMDDAFEKGMVLVMSLWDDHEANMLWLDSVYPPDKPDGPGNKRGTCATSSGVPKDVEKDHPDSHVKFSNVRFGEIGSTTGPSPPSPSPSPSPSPTPTPSGCPGGGLSECIQLCPSTPAAAFKACVDVCVARCSPTLLEAAVPAEAGPWEPCSASLDCVTGFECLKRTAGAQCVPSALLFEAFSKTQPDAKAFADFLRDGTTRFSAAGLAA